MIRFCQVDSFPANAFVITDTNIEAIYPHLVTNGYVMDVGEGSKTLETYETIIYGLPKTTELIVGLGGGVCTDMAGFVAATYRRGMRLALAPTSLLAMVDAAIGGKNGVNLGNLKNYVGTIYEPEEVLIDVRFLNTLPEVERHNGMAEVIKYYLLFGSPNPSEPLTDLSYLICIDHKQRAIQRDRNILNFGHTVGHSIELLAGLRHGEAIAIGMVQEWKIGNKMGIISGEDVKRAESILREHGFKTDMPNVNIDDVMDLIRQDKKGIFTFSFSSQYPLVTVDEECVRGVLIS